MGGNSCFVPGCRTGYVSERKKCKIQGKRSKSLFKPPKDPLLFEKWKIAIPRADKKLSKNAAVCELHFPPDDVLEYYITKLKDGTVHKLKRGSRRLKADAIPCIFPNLPAYFNRNAPKTKRKSSGKKKRKLEPVIADEVERTLLTTIQPSVLFNDFTFKDLVENLDEIKRPSEWWCISPIVEHIICSKWNSEYVSEKRVVIKEDLEVKVFLRDSEYEMLENKRINCIDDVSVLLEKVDKLIFLNAGIQQVK